MRPINDQILILYVEPAEEKTQGGLYVPPPTNKLGGTANNFLKKGTIVGIGKGVSNELDVTVGNNVLFDYRARVVVPNENNYFLVNEKNIYAVLDD